MDRTRARGGSGITDLEGGREKRVEEEETIDAGISTTMVGWIQRGIGRASKGMRESASNHEFNAFYDVHGPSFTVRVDRFPTVSTLVLTSARNHGGSYRFFVRCSFFSNVCLRSFQFTRFRAKLPKHYCWPG